ncbi:hypothetical protein ONZ43_g472 [Nemania bipapillata]|uniref:Uncharacterized protein n=1 Tax=Nemania bipapillata TaxID=110536 RepID=A0ACC2J8F1_9PEZI|nr:hypothetical protein ONZ43_g472 [Nemania bipapillata]
MTTLAEHFQIGAEEQDSMLTASSSGDIGTLKRLLVEHGVQRTRNAGNPPSDQALTPEESDKSATTSLSIYTVLKNAVAARQLAVVKLILQTYPALKLSQGHWIARAVLGTPDPDILQTLCAHDHHFASLSMDYGLRSFLTDACALPPAQAVPILHVLLDNDADVDDGCGPGGGALYAAIRGGQPVEIVDRILSKASMVSPSNGIAAIRRGDVDVVRALFLSETATRRFGVEECVEEAKKTGDKEIVASVQKWAQKKVDKETARGNREVKKARRSTCNFLG